MKSYEIIKPPGRLVFDRMSKPELKEYFQWYHSVVPSRMEQLEQLVRDTGGDCANWIANFQPDSLDVLGRWFETQVRTRKRTKDEMTEIQSRSNYPMIFPDTELTDRTFSLAIDVGMYLGETLLKNNPTVKWSQNLTAKKFIDYGQPILLGFGRLSFNPVRMAIGLAYRISSGTDSGTGLRKIYDLWSVKV